MLRVSIAWAAIGALSRQCGRPNGEGTKALAILTIDVLVAAEAYEQRATGVRIPSETPTGVIQFRKRFVFRAAVAGLLDSHPIDDRPSMLGPASSMKGRMISRRMSSSVAGERRDDVLRVSRLLRRGRTVR